MIRALDWLKGNAEQAEIRRLIINSAPKMAATRFLQVVCTDDVSVHLTYGVAGRTKAKGGTKGDDGQLDKQKDLPTVETPLETLDQDGSVKFKSGNKPTSALRNQVIVTCDPGVREETMVATPAVLQAQLERAAHEQLVAEDFLDAEDAAKVRGNRQLAAAVFESIARSKQQRQAEQYALKKVNEVLKEAQEPTSVEQLQSRLRELVHITNMNDLLDAIRTGQRRSCAAVCLLSASVPPRTTCSDAGQEALC